MHNETDHPLYLPQSRDSFYNAVFLYNNKTKPRSNDNFSHIYFYIYVLLLLLQCGDLDKK